MVLWLPHLLGKSLPSLTVCFLAVSGSQITICNGSSWSDNITACKAYGAVPSPRLWHARLVDQCLHPSFVKLDNPGHASASC